MLRLDDEARRAWLTISGKTQLGNQRLQELQLLQGQPPAAVYRQRSGMGPDLRQRVLLSPAVSDLQSCWSQGG